MGNEKSPLSKQKHWVVGVAVALVGVLCSRVIAPQCIPEAQRLVASIVGHFVCFLGLFIIAYGVYRKHRDEDEQS